MKILKSKRFWKFMKRTAQFTVVTVIVLIALGVWHHYHISNLVEAELENVRQRNEPLTPADLHALYAKPAGSEEVNDQWQAVLTDLQEIAARPDLLDVPFGPEGDSEKYTDKLAWQPTEEEVELLARYADAVEEPLERASRISQQHEKIHYEIDFEAGIQRELRAGSLVRQLNRALTHRTLHDQQTGNSESIYESLIIKDRLAETLRDVPESIMQLIRVTIINSLANDLHQYAARFDFTEQQLAELQARLLDYDAQQAMRLALYDERVTGQLIFHEDGNPIDGVPAYMQRFRRADQLAFHRWVSRFADANEHPFHEPAFEEVEVQWTDEFNGRGILYSIHERRFVWTSTMYAGIENEYSAYNRTLMQTRATATMLACQRYRLRHGDFPDALTDISSDIMAELPADPYLPSQPFRYKQLDDRMLIYSVGYNQVDDGGDGTFWEIWGPDVVFTMFTKLPEKPTPSAEDLLPFEEALKKGSASESADRDS